MPIEIVEDDFKYMKAIVGGQPGSGKTRWASTWPNVVYIDAEGRLLSVRDRKVRRWRIESTTDIKEVLSHLRQAQDVREKVFGGPVETVVIDTVDEIARIIISERLKATGNAAMQRDDWGYLKDELSKYVRAFRNLDDMHVLFNLHLKTEVLDSDTGRYEVVPQIQGAMQTEIFNFTDIAVLLTAESYSDSKQGRMAVRRLHTLPDKIYPWIKDHTGAIPNEFIINFEDDYVRLATHVFGEVPPPVMSSLELAEKNFASNAADMVALAEELRSQDPELMTAEERQEADRQEAERRAAERKAESEAAKAEVAAMRAGKALTVPTEPTLAPEPDDEPKADDAPAPAEGAAKKAPSKRASKKAAPKKSEPEPEPEPAAAASEPEPEPEPAAAAPDPEPAPPEEPATAPEPEPVVDEPVIEPEPDDLEGSDALDEDDAAALAASVFEGSVPEDQDVGEAGEVRQIVDQDGETLEPTGEEAIERVAEASAAADAAEAEAPTDEGDGEAEATVPEEGTAAGEPAAEGGSADPMICAKCGEEFDDEDIYELSIARYREPLCPVDFAARKKKPKT